MTRSVQRRGGRSKSSILHRMFMFRPEMRGPQQEQHMYCIACSGRVGHVLDIALQRFHFHVFRTYLGLGCPICPRKPCKRSLSIAADGLDPRRGSERILAHPQKEAKLNRRLQVSLGVSKKRDSRTQQFSPGAGDRLMDLWHVSCVVLTVLPVLAVTCCACLSSSQVKTMCWRSPLNTFTRLFHRPCACSFEIFFFAEAEQLREDLAWAAGRKKSQARAMAVNVNVHEMDVSDPKAWMLGLTADETKHLDFYVSKWPGRVCYLNQNPAVTAMKSTETKLNTMIKNVGAMWSDKADPPRLMNPYEILATQVFPVLPEHSHGKVTCSFQLKRPRGRTALAVQAGNAMNVAVIGTCILYALTQIKRADDGHVYHMHKLRKIAGLSGA